MAERNTIEATIRAYTGAWAAKDRVAWLDTFVESATQEDPVGSRVRRGRAEIGEFWDTALAAYDSIEIVPRDIVVLGDEAVMAWTIHAATPRGAITFTGVDVFTFDGAGRIASVRAYWERPVRREETMKTANARFAIKTWDEKPYGEGQDLPKLTRASVTKTFTGDLEGEGEVEYLMVYRGDGSATFVGLERVVGRIGGKAGSFVLQRTGVFEGGQAKEVYSVVPGSATGELEGLRGDGSSAVGHGTEFPFTLNYELV